jgi:hypothetical protein
MLILRVTATDSRGPPPAASGYLRHFGEQYSAVGTGRTRMPRVHWHYYDRILYLGSMQRLTTAQEDRRVPSVPVTARKGRRAVALAAAICRRRDRSIAVHHHRWWGGRWGSSRLWKLIDADTDARISGLHDGGLRFAAGSMHRVYRACKRHTILLGGMHVHAHHRSEWAEHRQRLRPELLGRGLAVVRRSGQLLLVT